ncbi:hypothetical protein RUM44_003999 [Polyplax serrata]|uniref:C2H2-type domain-containing protein n=1 Tax=Polyplax serrata TaxID=468196 RepID=A0ABR1B1K9_POLSC
MERPGAQVEQSAILKTSGSGCCAWNLAQYPQVIEFRCTWPGCCYSVCDLPSIEYHVRQTHLGPKKETDLDDLSDHEEEFYYTEVEVSRADVMTNVTMTPPVHPHKDMCRPSHEDPDYQKTRGYPIVRSSSNTPTANTPWSSFTRRIKSTLVKRPDLRRGKREEKQRNAERCTGWSTENCGAHNVNGKRHAAGLGIKAHRRKGSVNSLRLTEYMEECFTALTWPL